MREERTATWQSTWIQLRLYRNPRVSSSAGSKNCSIYTPPPVRVDPRRGIPDIWLDLPCGDRGGARWGEPAPSIASMIFPFSPLLRRVIVVARSHPVLATGPCWHSSFPSVTWLHRCTTRRHESSSASPIGRARRRLALKGATSLAAAR